MTVKLFKRSVCMFLVLVIIASVLLGGCDHSSEISEITSSANERSLPKVMSIYVEDEDETESNFMAAKPDIYDLGFVYENSMTYDMYDIESYEFQNCQYSITCVEGKRNAYQKAKRWKYVSSGDGLKKEQCEIVLDEDTQKAIMFCLEDKSADLSMGINKAQALLVFYSFMSAEYPEIDFGKYDVKITNGESNTIYEFSGERYENGILIATVNAKLNGEGRITYFAMEEYCLPGEVPDYTANEYFSAASKEIQRFFGSRDKSETVNDIKITGGVRGGYIKELDQYGVMFKTSFDVTNANGEKHQQTADFISLYGEPRKFQLNALIETVYDNLDNGEIKSFHEYEISIKSGENDYRTENFGDAKTIQAGEYSQDLYYQYNYRSRSGIDYVRYAFDGLHGDFNLKSGYFDSYSRENSSYPSKKTEKVGTDEAMKFAEEFIELLNPTIDVANYVFSTIKDNGYRYTYYGSEYRNGIVRSHLQFKTDTCGNVTEFSYTPFVATEKLREYDIEDFYIACIRRLEKFYAYRIRPKYITDIFSWTIGEINGYFIPAESAYVMQCYIYSDFSKHHYDYNDSNFTICVIYDYAEGE